MSQVILEKLDAIEAQQAAKIEAAVEAVKSEVTDKIASLEAKVAQVQAPAIIRELPKSVRQDVNRAVREQLKSFSSGKSQFEKELVMFQSEEQMQAYLKEASALTAGGDGKGGRTAYDPIFAQLRLANPMRGLSRTVTTDGSSYQFRVKTGNAGAQWGYGVQNNGASTTEDTSIGGADGLRGLDQYGGANATYAGGTTSASALGSSGTGSSSGLHSLATYDQLTSNVNTVGANNIIYTDVINMIYALPQEYWTP